MASRKKPAARLQRGSPEATVNRTQMVNRLQKLSLFSDLSKPELLNLAFVAQWQKILSGTPVFKEGEAGNVVYLIERGRVLISQNKKNGQSQTIAILSDGDFFGEMGFLESKTRSATAKALEDCLLIAIPGERMLEWVQKKPSVAVHIGMKVVRALSERLRQTTQELTRLHAFTEALLGAKTKEEIFKLAAQELVLMIAPEVALGWVLYGYNPYLQELTPMEHGGEVPSSHLAPKKTMPEDGVEFHGLRIGQEGNLLLFKPHSRNLLKKIPLLETFSGILSQSLLNMAGKTEEELRQRLKSSTIST